MSRAMLLAKLTVDGKCLRRKYCLTYTVRLDSVERYASY